MKLLTTSGAMKKLGILSRETLRKRKNTPGFPQPIHDPGSPVDYFIEDELDQYIERLREVRDHEQEDAQSAAGQKTKQSALTDKARVVNRARSPDPVAAGGTA